MKVIDVIFALIFGRILGFLVGDFLREWGIGIGFYWGLFIWLFLPVISLFFLWLAYLIGRKMLFVFQGAKHILVGAVATVFDLKIFEFLVWIFAFFIPLTSLVPKGISFILSILLKYWGNKYWAFQKHERENLLSEIIQFFVITFIGLIIDVVSFYYFTKIMGQQFGLPGAIWLKLSVIFAAVIAAVWNFSGYKFLVFKK